MESGFHKAEAGNAAHLTTAFAKEAPDPEFKGFLACYNNLTETLFTDLFGAPVDSADALIVPGTRAGRQGVYFFTDSTAYFHVLTEPASEDSSSRTYMIQLDIPQQSSLYGTYLENKGSRSAAFSYLHLSRTVPRPQVQGRYKRYSASDALDQGARETMSNYMRDVITQYESQAVANRNIRETIQSFERCANHPNRAFSRFVQSRIEKLRKLVAQPSAAAVPPRTTIPAK
jgi:hypothetical protein